jgi:heme/copper-type cytochrome/quinol oxidase subunit 3
MTPQTAIDVSQLPASTMDHRSPIWWGNLLLLCIETTMFALLVGCYFYIRQNYTTWPPPKVHDFPVIYDSTPLLGIPTINLLILLLSCLPMAWVDKACLQHNQSSVTIGLMVVILCGIVTIAFRFLEFGSLLFKWNENAYASTVWTILGMHLLHQFTATLELGLLLAWLLVNNMDIKHARDIRVTAVYWYWIAGIWLLLYVVVYLSPRFI